MHWGAAAGSVLVLAGVALGIVASALAIRHFWRERRSFVVFLRSAPGPLNVGLRLLVFVVNTSARTSRLQGLCIARHASDAGQVGRWDTHFSADLPTELGPDEQATYSMDQEVWTPARQWPRVWVLITDAQDRIIHKQDVTRSFRRLTEE